MKTIKLLQGKYSSEEARELLLNTINSKINFHKIQNFSSQVRYNKPDAEANQRIRELEEARNHILAITQLGEESTKQLVIESSIKITLQTAGQPQERYLNVSA